MSLGLGFVAFNFNKSWKVEGSLSFMLFFKMPLPLDVPEVIWAGT
jgi:hypothetical protein